MDFKTYLQENALLINDQLDQILTDFLNQTKKTDIKLTPFAIGLINSCKGGKRIRGVLVKLGYEIATGPSDPRNDVVRVGAAFEILHTALLIHDDIADKSLTRRGQKSLYQAFGGGHYGISQAINVGDIGLYLPIKIITESSFLEEVKIKALSYLSQTIINTGWGQIMDVELTQSNHTSEEKTSFGTKPTSEVMEFINLFKTAKYTIAGPLQLGAILAGAEAELFRVLGEFGENAGIAFQIQDDILDGEVDSVDKARLEAVKYADTAKGIIPKLTKQSKMRKLLEEMCEFMVERSK